MPTKPAATHPNAEAFPAGLSAPALRALANAGIRSVAQLAQHSQSSVASLHGMGPKGVRLLMEALAREGRRFHAS
jgi:predicted RecB family nuclease